MPWRSARATGSSVSLKSMVKERFPALVAIHRRVRPIPRKILLTVLPREAVFNRVYRRNGWGNSESVSGVGSELAVTRVVRQQLPALVSELGARSFLDIPCGDLNWMKEVDLGVERYIGADIVQSLVDTNREKYGNGTREFTKLDLATDDLPKVDIVFCRDCLIHLSFEDIAAVFRNIRRSGSRYLLTTTHPDCEVNVDILTGEFRNLDLEKAPFNLPPPLRLIDEEWDFIPDKSLGLWNVADLP